MTKLERLLISSCDDVLRLSKREKWKIQQQWREIFSVRLKEQEGKWSIGGVDWHIFAYGYADSIRGAKASDMFNRMAIDNFYCISSIEQIPSFKCKGSCMPKANEFIYIISSASQILDLYVLPTSFEWTMVFVHEADIGPFFAECKGRGIY